MAAAVMAVATLATSMVPFSADAFSVDKNSKFTYDLKVEGNSRQSDKGDVLYNVQSRGFWSFCCSEV